jgi:hypothetical protein
MQQESKSARAKAQAFKGAQDGKCGQRHRTRELSQGEDAAAGAGALARQRSGVDPARIPEGEPARLERVGNRVLHQYGGVGGRADAETAQVSESNQPQDASGNRTAGAATAAPAHTGGLRQLDSAWSQAQAEERDQELKNWKEARAQEQKANELAFSLARKDWRDKVKKSVARGNTRAKYFALSLWFDKATFYTKGVLFSEESQPDLAERLAIGERTVQRAATDLEAAGVLSVSRRFNPKTRRNEINQYYAVGYRNIRKRPKKPRGKVPF